MGNQIETTSVILFVVVESSTNEIEGDQDTDANKVSVSDEVEWIHLLQNTYIKKKIPTPDIPPPPPPFPPFPFPPSLGLSGVCSVELTAL
jgi:hypothetical protein